MKCENCLKEIDGSFGSGRFCNVSCARSFSSNLKREEVNRKVSKKLKGRKSLTSVGFSDEQRRKAQETLKNKAILDSEYKLQNLPFDQLSFVLKREKIRREQDSSCLVCKYKEWNNQLILLELDHINGNKKDNSRENLRLICPNCHSQTKTYKTKNISNSVKIAWRKHISETRLKKARIRNLEKRIDLKSIDFAGSTPVVGTI